MPRAHQARQRMTGNTVTLTVGDGDLATVLAWYDNEMGYAAQMLRAAVKVLG